MNTVSSTAKPAASGARIKILVVDDCPVVQKSLALILELAGNCDLVGTATDGCEAIRLAETLAPDLVLVDFHLPQLDGLQVARRIKQLAHSPVIFIVTSDQSEFARAKAERAGVEAFVIKDGNLQHRLIELIRGFFDPSREQHA